jgi:putative intracellular protease/amidase
VISVLSLLTVGRTLRVGMGNHRAGMRYHRRREFDWVDSMTVPYVLVVATNAAVIGPHHRPTGFFFPEIAHPSRVLDRHGIAVEYASPLGGKPPEDGFDGDDTEQTAFLDSKAYRRLSRSRKLSEVDVLDYDAVFIPGGLGPMVDITGNPEVQDTVLRAWNAGLIVSAVCHGPSAFLGVTLDDGTPLVQGRKLTSFSSAEEGPYAGEDVPFDLEQALRAEGARYESTDPWQPKLVVDGRLITGQNPQSGTLVGEALASALADVQR